MLVSVRTEEASSPGHVSTVAIVQEGRQFATAECQTEEPPARRARREEGRRERRPRRRPRAPPAPPPYSTLPTIAHLQAFHPVPIPVPRGDSFRCGGVVPLSVTSPCQAPPLCIPQDLTGPPASTADTHKRWPPWRWCVLLLAIVGICCVLAGAILGALRSQPRAHLTLLLLMIGAGAVLVVSAGVAWRAASRPFAPCRRLLAALSLSLSSNSHHTHTLTVPHTNRHRLLRDGRRILGVHQPANILYPEFQYRQPPPSYQASMQEYRLSRLLLLDRSAPMAVSPPPTYRSHNGTLIRNAVPGSEHSYPPSYRSRALNRPPSRLGAQSVECCGRSVSVMSEPLSLSPAALTHTLNNVVIQNISYDDFKYSDELSGENKEEANASANGEVKDEVRCEQLQRQQPANLVTIVQTNCSEDFGPVILTISNSPNNPNLTYQHVTGEIDILAHL